MMISGPLLVITRSSYSSSLLIHCICMHVCVFVCVCLFVVFVSVKIDVICYSVLFIETMTVVLCPVVIPYFQHVCLLQNRLLHGCSLC